MPTTTDVEGCPVPRIRERRVRTLDEVRPAERLDPKRRERPSVAHCIGQVHESALSLVTSEGLQRGCDAPKDARQIDGSLTFDQCLVEEIDRQRRKGLRHRPKSRHERVDAQKLKFRRALDSLEDEAGTFGGTVDIGTITIGCALGYLDFRYADEDWRPARPRLAAWFERFAARPAMARTAPVEIW